MTDTAILSAIDQELASVEGNVAKLRQKVRAIMQGGSAASDARENVDPDAPMLPVVLTQKGAFHPRGFWFGGAFHHCWTQIDIYIGLLRAIAEVSQEALPRAAAALRLRAHSRSYLATDPTQLFRGQTPEWARAHSRPVADGWYADTNLSLELKKQLIRRVLQANALREGADVIIVWTRTPVGHLALGSGAQSEAYRSH